MNGGCHVQLAAARDQLLAELDGLDEPLPAGDDLERPIALLVELHRVRDRTRRRRADRRSRRAARRSSRAPSAPTDPPPGRMPPGRAPRSVVSHSPAPHAIARKRPSGRSTARTGSDSSRHQVTSVTSPNVQIIAAPVPFSGLASGCARTGTRAWKSGVIDIGAEQRLVPLVVRMRHQRHARRDQLRARGVDLDEAAAVGPREADAVVRARAPRGPRARPGPPRCGSRCPRASAPRADRPSPRSSRRTNARCETRCASFPTVV